MENQGMHVIIYGELELLSPVIKHQGNNSVVCDIPSCQSLVYQSLLKECTNGALTTSMLIYINILKGYIPSKEGVCTHSKNCIFWGVYKHSLCCNY